MKQTALKPQDLLMAGRVAMATAGDSLTFATLAASLNLSASEAHASVQRGQASGLLVREFGELRANRVALMEFIVHGLKYAFPPVFGPVTTGCPTAGSAPPLAAAFAAADDLRVVWPDKDGTTRGIALCPLYPTVPEAARRDRRLYEVMALIDAIRAGASRERELAHQHLPRYFA
ncbi:hypothetical protein CDN99_26635 [Roseateles aquatilis]|uniref:HTH iclR-type domain-containing protein n=1 Tax=Roseateles aquatilis TaxID=431061 RepID=A0A246ITY3_9BURK|nr:hypothetical protein [Roseateles aquatilis]OWQ83219.1 hypothetical protein CDN99_26635 [Roseateles aquatilis]